MARNGRNGGNRHVLAPPADHLLLRGGTPSVFHQRHIGRCCDHRAIVADEGLHRHAVERASPYGSQVGSHSLWTGLDGRGYRWNRNRSGSGRGDIPGRPWTQLGDLRIRRLGVRVAPGALRKPLCRMGFCRVRVETDDPWPASARRLVRTDQSPTSVADGNRTVTRFSGPGLIPPHEKAPTLTGPSPLTR